MFNIDTKSTNPVYLEIANNIIKLIINGTYQPNDKLPSIRYLSNLFSINHNTVNRAYLELEHRGYIYPIQGKGMFVKENIEELNDEEKRKLLLSFADKVKELAEISIEKQEIDEIVNKIYSDK